MRDWLHSSERHSSATRRAARIAPICRAIFQATLSTKPATGYKFWFTCNDWVRKALSEAGVRAPLWAPFDTALFYQLQKIK